MDDIGTVFFKELQVNLHFVKTFAVPISQP